MKNANIVLTEATVDDAEEMNHRRITALLMSLVILFSLSGCGVTDKAAKIINDDPKTDEKEYAEQVFEYLKNEDIDSLCELFASDVCAEHSLESEWKNFFDHMDGKIVSYEGLQCFLQALFVGNCKTFLYKVAK